MSFACISRKKGSIGQANTENSSSIRTADRGREGRGGGEFDPNMGNTLDVSAVFEPIYNLAREQKAHGNTAQLNA